MWRSSFAVGIAISLAGAILTVSRVAAQSSDNTPSRPRFDVASVKLADETTVSGSHGGPGTGDPGRITFGRVDLIFLLMQAYGVQRDQVVGAQTRLGNGPGYSVTATMPRDTTREQFRLMLQTLLVERFHLVLHHETKPFPGYELTVSPGGAKLKEVTVHEDTLTPEAIAEIARSTALQKDEKGFPALPPGLPWRFVSPHLGTVGMIRTRFHASIAKFLEVLPSMIIQSDQVPPALVPQPRVEDRTGLNGVYDFTLEFVGGMLLPAGSLAGALLANQSPGGGPPSVPAADDPTGGAGGPTLFAALEKQLGLTLKKMKDVQVDMIVVDHADKIPTDN